MEKNNDPTSASHQQGFSIGGEANAINHLNQSDSHNQTDSHNVENSNNVTNVYYGASATEKMQADNEAAYRTYCKSNIKNGIISKHLRDELDDRARSLNLDEATQRSIEQSVIRHTSATDTISDAAAWAVDDAKSAINNNVRDLRPLSQKLLAMAHDTDYDEVQCYTYLILAVMDPTLCVKSYESRTYDNYWQSYWTYLAYKANGNARAATQVLASLGNWDYPTDNLILLNCADKLYDYYVHQADASCLNWLCSNLPFNWTATPLLETFYTTIAYLLQNSERPMKPSSSNACNFYMRLLGADKQSVATRIAVTPQPSPLKQHPVPQPASQPQSRPQPQPVAQPQPQAPIQNTKGTTKQGLQPMVILSAVVIVLVAGFLIYQMASGGDAPNTQAVATQTTESVESGAKASAPDANAPTTDAAATGVSATDTPTETAGDATRAENNTPSTVTSKKSTTTTSSAKSATTKSSAAEPADADYAAGMDYYAAGQGREAISSFEQSGSAESIYMIGQIYERGCGTIGADALKARDYYKKAARMGSAAAKAKL